MSDLHISYPDGRSEEVTLAAFPQVVGRDRSCDIVLEDPSTSRRHARFTPTSSGFLVEDLGSKNGTYVNDEPCTSKVVTPGDTVTLGSVVLVYHDPESASEASVVIEDDEVSQSRATHYAGKDQQLHLSQQRLKVIYDLMERLTTLRAREHLLQETMNVCFEMLQFERGAIAVRRPGQRALDWPVVHNLRGAEGELKISGTLLRRALEHGERAIFTDDGSQPIDPTISIVQQGIRSAMCVPLMHEDEILGVIYGDRTSTSAVYSQEDSDFLAAIARQVSIGLVNARLVEEQKAMARLNHDVDLARTIQKGLFPTEMPARPGFKVAAINEPGARVSGDYYDVVETDDGRVWLLIADVTGEGVAASLLMANLQAAVRVTIEGKDDPAALLARWNELIVVNTDESKFITALLMLVDPEKRSLTFASAGHHAPMILVGDSTDPVDLGEEGGYPLGIDEDATFENVKLDLNAPFLLLTYTDGVFEAMNPNQDLFGIPRMQEVMVANRDQTPQGLVKQIRKAVTQFADGAPQSDDITMLAARVG